MIKAVFGTVALLCVATAAPATAARPTLYVFGDSLADTGNAYLGSGGLAANPAFGYFQGRFSNGPVFTDYIAKGLNGSFSKPFLLGGSNYAVGGARAAGNAVDAGSGLTIPGLNTQLGIYGSVSGGAADPNGVYLIDFGNNDVNAILGGDTYGLTPQAYGAQYASNFANAVLGLSLAGATKIIVLGVPNPSNPVGQALQAQLNAALDSVSPFVSAQVTRFDLFGFFTRLQAHPTEFGLTADVNFTTPCIAARPVIAGSIDCTGYFSFDGIHPTAPVHLALGREVSLAAGLAAVPESSTWAMLIAGFGLVGAAARRRRMVAITH